jgi:hypothetical protein
MSTLKVNEIIDSNGDNTTTVNGIPLRPGVLDPENRIINGAFDFWQRGTSFTTSGYGADRWINAVVGGTVTMSRQAFVPGDTVGGNNFGSALRQTVSGQTLASHAANVTQRIESVRTYAGQTITVLGWARRTSGSGNMTVDGFQYFGTGGSPSPSPTVNLTPVSIALTGSWQPFAAVFAVPSVAGETIGTNNDDYLGIRFWTSAGSDWDASTNSLGLQTIGVDFVGIHIKVGTHTTAAVDLYRRPEPASELARCQRYYETGSYYEVSGVTSSSIIASVYTYTRWTVAKRTTPSVTGTNAQGTFATTSITYEKGSLGRSDVVANRANSGTFAADAEL